MRRLERDDFLQAYADYTRRTPRPNEKALALLVACHAEASGDTCEVAAKLIEAVVTGTAFDPDDASLAHHVGLAVALTRLFLGLNGRLLLFDPEFDDLVWRTALCVVPIEVLTGSLRTLTVSSATDFGPATGS